MTSSDFFRGSVSVPSTSNSANTRDMTTRVHDRQSSASARARFTSALECAHPPRARLCGTRIRFDVFARASAGEKRTASRSADGTRGRPFPSHRVVASPRPDARETSTRDRSIRFDSIRFDSTTSIRYLYRRDVDSSPARARDGGGPSSASVAVGRAVTNLHRICIESASNLNRIESARRADRRGTRRPIVVRSSSRLVSSRLVSSSGSRRRARVVSCRSHGRSPCHTRTLFHPFLIHSTTTRPTRVCVVVTSRDPCHCPCPAPVPRVCVRTRGFERLHYEREDDAGATSVRPRARRPPRARPHPRRRHTTTTTTTTR